MRHQRGIVAHALFQTRTHKHARQQLILRIGHDHAHGHAAGVFIDRDFGKFQFAFLFVLAAVFQQDGDRHRVLLDLAQLARGKVLPQAQHLRARLRHIHINRVQLLHGDQHAGLIARHQRALRNAGAPGAPANRAFHAGVVQVDARTAHRRFGFFLRRLRQQQGRLRVFALLLADGGNFAQIFVAFRRRFRRGQLRLGFRQLGLGAVVSCLIAGSVNLIEHLPGFDLRAFFKQAFLHDAGDLRAHFGDQMRFGAPLQFRDQRHVLQFHGDHADRHLLRTRARLARRARPFLLTAGDQRAGRHGRHCHPSHFQGGMRRHCKTPVLFCTAARCQPMPPPATP